MVVSQSKTYKQKLQNDRKSNQISFKGDVICLYADDLVQFTDSVLNTNEQRFCHLFGCQDGNEITNGDKW